MKLLVFLKHNQGVPYKVVVWRCTALLFKKTKIHNKNFSVKKMHGEVLCTGDTHVVGSFISKAKHACIEMLGGDVVLCSQPLAHQGLRLTVAITIFL